MSADFEVDQIAEPARAIFESVKARLTFEADLFLARASIGEDMLGPWLETQQTSRTFTKRSIVELEKL
jgi:hypothetical protein